jgi:hypothetical protein
MAQTLKNKDIKEICETSLVALFQTAEEGNGKQAAAGHHSLLEKHARRETG